MHVYIYQPRQPCGWTGSTCSSPTARSTSSRTMKGEGWKSRKGGRERVRSGQGRERQQSWERGAGPEDKDKGTEQEGKGRQARGRGQVGRKGDHVKKHARPSFTCTKVHGSRTRKRHGRLPTSTVHAPANACQGKVQLLGCNRLIIADSHADYNLLLTPDFQLSLLMLCVGECAVTSAALEASGSAACTTLFGSTFSVRKQGCPGACAETGSILQRSACQRRLPACDVP
eukprot:361545-Chlamydomonas_euryale.AAC.6